MGVGGSMHTALGWRGQFERTARWFARVEKISIERHQTGDLHRHQDFIYAFFQNCYHLREWLVESGVVPQCEMERLFQDHVELQICRDVCNGTKHMQVKRPSIDGDYSIFREYDHFHVDRPDDGPHSMEYLFVLAGSHKYDLFELARKCMAIWEQFLRGKRLLS